MAKINIVNLDDPGGEESAGGGASDAKKRSQKPTPKTPRIKKTAAPKKIQITHDVDAEVASTKDEPIIPKTFLEELSSKKEETVEVAPSPEVELPIALQPSSPQKKIIISHVDEEPIAAEEVTEDPQPVDEPVVENTDEDEVAEPRTVEDTEVHETGAPETEEQAGPEEAEIPEEPSPEISEADGSPEQETIPIVEEPAKPPTPSKNAVVIDDVIRDIARRDSDDLLEAEDAHKEIELTPVKRTFGQKVANFFSIWWNVPWLRWPTILLLILGVAGVGAYPNTRYYLLNSAGVRVTTSVQVVDDKTEQPLKRVTVTIGDQSGLTDDEGKVSLKGLKLGKLTVAADKRAFAQYKKDHIFGWGSNPLEAIRLTPTGSQYTFIIKDWLSDKPISKVEVSGGLEASALSDADGKAVLNSDNTEDKELAITVKAPDYRDEKISLSVGSKTIQQVKLVPSRKHIFVSKRSGKYDVYKIDADGKNEEKILAGTGNERDDLTLIPQETGSLAAFVSTREGAHNKDGFVLSGLYVIDVNSGDNTKLSLSEQVQVIGWIGDKLIYVQIAEGASGTNPKRHRLISYDTQKNESKELAASNYFNDLLIAKGVIYYAPSNSFQESTTAFMYRINADGTGKQSLLDRETWNMFRTDYNKLTVSVQQDWYEYTLGTSKAVKLATNPVTPKNKVYVDSPNGQNSLWVDDRDAKGVLLLYSTKDGKETELVSKVGIKNPIYWLNDKFVVYRVSSGSEIADYILNIEGGEAKKIQDVANTGGIDHWYYY
jgi:hypothetical protein